MPKIGDLTYFIAAGNISLFHEALKLLDERYFVPFDECYFLVVPFLQTKTTLAKLASWRQGLELSKHAVRLVLMYDSGGYEVEMGRFSFTDLITKLRRSWDTSPIPDYLVLPDNPPTINDSREDVLRKVEETVEAAFYFIRHYPELLDKMIAPIHGLEPETILECARTFYDAGLRYFAFGSIPAIAEVKRVSYLTPIVVERLTELSKFCLERNVKLHLFGISAIGMIVWLRLASVWFSSFDSASLSRQSTTARAVFPEFTVELAASRLPYVLKVSKEAVKQSKHWCPFCADLIKLATDYHYCYAHNLLVWLEQLEEIVHNIPVNGTVDKTASAMKLANIGKLRQSHLVAAKVGKLI